MRCTGDLPTAGPLWDAGAWSLDCPHACACRPNSGGACNDAAFQSRRRFTEAEFEDLNLQIGNLASPEMGSLISGVSRTLKKSKLGKKPGEQEVILLSSYHQQYTFNVRREKWPFQIQELPFQFQAGVSVARTRAPLCDDV